MIGNYSQLYLVQVAIQLASQPQLFVQLYIASNLAIYITCYIQLYFFTRVIQFSYYHISSQLYCIDLAIQLASQLVIISYTYSYSQLFHWQQFNYNYISMSQLNILFKGVILVLPKQVRPTSLLDSVANRLYSYKQLAISYSYSQLLYMHMQLAMFTKFVNADASHNYFVISNHYHCKYIS